MCRAEQDVGGFFGEFVYKYQSLMEVRRLHTHAHTHTHIEDNKRRLKLIYTMSLVYNSAGSKGGTHTLQSFDLLII